LFFFFEKSYFVQIQAELVRSLGQLAAGAENTALKCTYAERERERGEREYLCNLMAIRRRTSCSSQRRLPLAMSSDIWRYEYEDL
jgi:hypothetical protein